MTTVSYALGRPRHALSRGGDCRAFDLSLGRKVQGMHRFVSPEHCQIINGLLSLTLSASGSVPTFAVEAWRGPVTIGDVYTDIYSDLYGGSESERAWIGMGSLVIDSPSVSAVVTDVRIAAVSDEAVVIRVVAPAIDDAWVMLRRGEPMVRIQHGSTRSPLVDTDRRIGWTASSSPVGVSRVGRVEESAPLVDGLPRFVASIDPVTTDAGTFSLTAASVTSARFGAGVGAYTEETWPDELHRQLGDASTGEIVVSW